VSHLIRSHAESGYVRLLLLSRPADARAKIEELQTSLEAEMKARKAEKKAREVPTKTSPT
jgi:hypothetical protein